MKNFGLLIYLSFMFLIGCNQEDKENVVPQKQTDVSVDKPLRTRDSIETIIGLRTPYFVKNSSKSFLRYSRNLVFAQKGYIFKDSNLQAFFEHQHWYKKSNTNNVELTKEESKRVQRLKIIEEHLFVDEYRKILYKSVFNGIPIFYIVEKPRLNDYGITGYGGGGFAFLDSTMLWTLEVPTIPPEYIMNVSVKYLEYDDYGFALEKHQIHIKNIDKGCVGGDYDELILYLEYPEYSYNDVILGYDKNRVFTVLFDKSVSIDKIVVINDTIIELQAEENWENGRSYKYRYNTVTKESRKVFEE